MLKAAEEILKEALLKAGIPLKRSIHASKRIRTKGASVNLVTEADRESEKTILQIIQRRFPDHSILAEESAPRGRSPRSAGSGRLGQAAGGRPVRSPYKWIIDPLDGTTNFAHGFPIAAVSIALEVHGDVTLGGVYDPFRDELFFARKAHGASLNGKKIRVSRTPELSRSLLVTGFPYDRKIRAREYLRIYEAFMIKCHGIRRTGSAAVDLCYVACGRFDGFWEQKLHPWDTAAASLIVREAAGRVTNFRGEPYSIYIPEILASNGQIHREMLRVLRPL